MQPNRIHIPHQNGNLIVSINENHEAILNDYTGSEKILFLPAFISYIDESGNEHEYEISPVISDESFGSCDKIEVLVINHDFEFGLFVFQNCHNLREIIEVDASCTIDEFSFTDERFCPKKMQVSSVAANPWWPHGEEDPDDYFDYSEQKEA